MLAVNDVKYLLPDEEVIHAEFGGQSNQLTDEVPMALGSALYEIHQKIIIDAQLFPYRSDEREIAFKHLKATQAGDLILYDEAIRHSGNGRTSVLSTWLVYACQSRL